MNQRIPLAQRQLPVYTIGEERMNMITHIIGGAIGVAVLVFCILIAASHDNVWGIVGGSIYGASLIALYTVSSVYHGLKPGFAKKVMQVVDHCTIYFLIAGTYTPILLSAIRPLYPTLSWVIFGAQWGIALIAAALTAIDLKKYSKFSMFCYLLMGWMVVLALKPTLEAVGWAGFWWLLAGGIFYTVGAVLYALGKKKKYFHSVFHIFVDFGSITQAICILLYVL
ncbi:MAG: hemolysin III family protein [Firmicutes bacterium]|nr:hemolysin III family protein [Bacillota bacterium]MBQ6810427.1 hemolysin III family protein [Bacillota bacterium]